MPARFPPVALALSALLCGAAAAADPQQNYMLYCMGCHGPQAEGVPGRVPPLAGALPRFMRTPEGRDYLLRVPGAANSALDDAQTTEVLNWLAQTYLAAGDPAPRPFTVGEVSASRHRPLANVQERRAEVVRALAASGPAPSLKY
ncbi:MAG: cytochrome c [Proteobacteria bacterium]|nr:cytochrome c [Pseudomonadota bacterium]